MRSSAAKEAGGTGGSPVQWAPGATPDRRAACPTHLCNLLILLALLAALTSRADRLEPWASSTDPTDVPRRTVQQITGARQEYTIAQGGTMDGENCRPPIGYAAWHQTWESNRVVRLENIGDTDVVNPWLSNGRNNFRSIEEIVAGALEPGMSDEEQAIALWRWEMSHRFHAYPADAESQDPVKVFNVYGYTLCGDDCLCLAGLWRTAGLKVRPARPTGHGVSEVFFGGKWHLLDGDEHCLFLLRDNETIASEADIVRDHDLIKRTHTYGILSGDSRETDEFSASLYVHDGEGGGERDCLRGHSMNMTLRPGEAITWRWGHTVPPKFHGLEDMKDWGQDAVDKVCDGLWEYRPEFGRDLWRRGAVSAEGIAAGPDGLRAEPGKTGTITWRMHCPYVLVGGRLEAEGTGAQFALSSDGKKWEEVSANLDALFSAASPARYEYLLRCELTGDARLRRLSITNDLQMAPLSLPGMVLGPNRFVYSDETKGQRQVRITHEWVERSSGQPPSAPSAPVFPTNHADVDGTQFTFEWQPPAAPEGDRIADYHFELSGRVDMKWPLSPNFEKLISNTADRGKAQFTVPGEGLLTPDRVYYWHVRAMSARGLWGPWSDVWSFKPHGPAPPFNVRLEMDAQRGVGVLRWDPNPVGRPPLRYRVYGSDEKGFSVSDEPYRVNTGNQKDPLPNPFGANFVAETPGTALIVIGPQASLPNANRAFYRVVAVDERSRRSGPSNYIESPRPFICSQPTLTAKAGVAYCCQVSTIRSIGDLRCHTRGDDPYLASFWDVERPRFTLTQGPDWLKMDESAGVLSGTPRVAGNAPVTVAAAIGNRERATRSFVINVSQ